MRLTIIMSVLGLLAACSREPPPRPLSDFMEDPILLEATMVRCAQNRSQTKYLADCVNAREAANRMAVVEDEARRKELDAQSERKRQSLRRTQQAAAEARRRRAEAQRLREEAEYLAQFESSPLGPTGPVDRADGSGGLSGNEPGAVILPPDAANGVDTTAEGPADLDAVREELKRRQEDSR